MSRIVCFDIILYQCTQWSNKSIQQLDFNKLCHIVSHFIIYRFFQIQKFKFIKIFMLNPKVSTNLLMDWCEKVEHIRNKRGR